MLNDLGNTQYYMLVGNKLTLHPVTMKICLQGYKYRDIKYGVVPGEEDEPATTLDWSDKLSYPLSLYLGVLHLLDAIDASLALP